jgi:integrase
LNRRGRPWTASAVRLRFARLEEKLGKLYTHYAFRHSWITRKLLAGVDSHMVAKLAGHSDTKMVDAVYSHVADDYKFMLEQAQKELRPSNGGGQVKEPSVAPTSPPQRTKKGIRKSAPQKTE